MPHGAGTDKPRVGVDDSFYPTRSRARVQVGRRVSSGAERELCTAPHAARPCVSRCWLRMEKEAGHSEPIEVTRTRRGSCMPGFVSAVAVCPRATARLRGCNCKRRQLVAYALCWGSYDTTQVRRQTGIAPKDLVLVGIAEQLLVMFYVGPPEVHD